MTKPNNGTNKGERDAAGVPKGGLRQTADEVIAEREAKAAAGSGSAGTLADDSGAMEGAAAAAERESDVDGAALLEGDVIDPEGDGTRVGMVLTMPMLLPVSRVYAVEWINRHVVSQGAGAHLIVGRVSGVAVKAETKLTEWQGKQLESVLLTGDFRMQAPGIGPDAPPREYEGAELYLPKQYARQVQVALALGQATVTFDIDIGIEATGRTIPYAWTITSHLRRRRAPELEQLWSRRTLRPGFAALPAGAPAAAALPGAGNGPAAGGRK